MTEQTEHPLVRGLLDRDLVEEDGSDVEDATELLLELRTDGEPPADAVPSSLDRIDSEQVGDGARRGSPGSEAGASGRHTGGNRDDQDPT